MKILKIVSLLFLTIFLIACKPAPAPVPPPKINANSNSAANFYELKPSENFISLGVKSYQQSHEYTCGPAAAMTLLKFYNYAEPLTKIREMQIAKEMGSSKKVGTSPKQLATWLQKKGFNVKSGTNGSLEMLRENLNNGIPTLVEWIDWGGHWAIVTGYYQAGSTPDPEKDTIFLADPAAQVGKVHNPDGIISYNAARFHSMWFDAQYFKRGHIVKGVYITAVPK